MQRSTSRWSPHVNHRADLTYIIGEMIGELNVGHAYVGGGDMPKVDAHPDGPARRRVSSATRQTGYYQIDEDPARARTGTRACARR